MTTFMFRASEDITARLSSAEMRSWLNDFIRQPHRLPPDPGSGYERFSLTLPADTVNAVATYSKSGISSALRRIAFERLGVKRQGMPQVYRATATTRTFYAGRSHDKSQRGNEIAAALICLLVWLMFLGISVVLASRKRNNVEVPQDNMTQEKPN